MNGFEVLFGLFGLVLGFTLVEMLVGLARTLEAHLRAPQDGVPPLRYGWLTPLLGLFVLIDATTFWYSAWSMRDQLAMTYPMLMLALFFTGSYFLAAHLVFPTHPLPGEDLDGHYFRVRRYVLGTLLTLSLIQVAGAVSWEDKVGEIEPWMWAEAALFHLTLIAGMVVRPKWANIAVLTALSAWHLYPVFVRF